MTEKEAKSCSPRPRTGQFRRPGGFEAKDLTLRGQGQGQGRPQGRHFWLLRLI